MYHLYEVELESPAGWIKLQASCSSVDQARTFFGSRFGGHDPDPLQPHLSSTSFSLSVPRQLSDCVDHIANWNSAKARVSAGWEDAEFSLAKGPYAWCETLSDGCDCHGGKGRLDVIYCSDLGSREDDKFRARKSPNIRLAESVQRMRDTLVKRQVASRDRQRVAVAEDSDNSARDQFDCPVHRVYHPYSERVQYALDLKLTALRRQMSAEDGQFRQHITPLVPTLTEEWRREIQTKECAEEIANGCSDIPDTLYKYIPAALLDKGPPASLRATQLSVLNDHMECNFVTMLNPNVDVLEFLALIQSTIKHHLGIDVSEEELLERSIRFGDLRLSTFVQEFLNPRVGVVSLSTDMLVPTMWTHYAQNSGVVVGYDSRALRDLGYELRPVYYSVLAPTFEPPNDDIIRLLIGDREDLERRGRMGQAMDSVRILASAALTSLGAGWKALSRLLFVKGCSWEYEKEVRLLVDLQTARNLGCDDDGYPIKVIDIPPHAIKEIRGSANTADADIARAAQVARGDDKRGLLVGHVSSHAFRMQRTSATQH